MVCQLDPISLTIYILIIFFLGFMYKKKWHILMATRSDFFKVTLLLLLFVFNLFLQSYSLKTDERDYKNWVSWNLQDFKKKLAGMEAQTSAAKLGGFGGIGGVVLDDKLRKAEMNKVRIIVSQDATGDFMSIGEALHSIPKPNNKRVILVINPGVYRYILLCSSCVLKVVLKNVAKVQW